MPASCPFRKHTTMKYIIKKPTGDTMTLTLENLEIRYDNGVIQADWPARSEDDTEWSTVGALVATYSPPRASSSSGAVTQTTTPPSDSFTSSVGRRYQDAYLVARATTAIGVAVKSIGIGLGVLIVIAAAIFGSQADRAGMGFVGGLVFGAVVAIPLYVLGVLVSAHGQVLKATLDTAVHSSPFLKKEDMARVMSL